MPHTGLRVGRHTLTKKKGDKRNLLRQISPLDELSSLFVERAVWEVQCPDAAGDEQTRGDAEEL